MSECRNNTGPDDAAVVLRGLATSGDGARAAFRRILLGYRGALTAHIETLEHEQPDLLSLKDAARWAGKSKRTIRRLIERGILDPLRVQGPRGEELRVRTTQLRAYLAGLRHEVPTPPAAGRAEDRVRPTNPPTDPLCPRCGQPMAWELQDTVKIGGGMFSERVLTCHGCQVYSPPAYFAWKDSGDAIRPETAQEKIARWDSEKLEAMQAVRDAAPDGIVKCGECIHWDPDGIDAPRWGICQLEEPGTLARLMPADGCGCRVGERKSSE